MKSWWKQEPLEESSKRGVVRAALAGASRSGLISISVSYLLANTEADRVGVWLEPPDATGRSGCPAIFRGNTADRDGTAAPVEWERLSPEAPLPVDVFMTGRAILQDLDASPDRPIVGPLIGIQRVVWAPVGNNGQLRGVLLAGLRRKNASDPQPALEQLSAELSLALEWESESRRARDHKDDVALTREVFSELAGTGPSDALLQRIVASCPTQSATHSMDAVFAVLREWPLEPRRTSGETDVEAGTRTWHSGDEAWARGMENEPLSALFARAREAHCPVANAPGLRWSSNDVRRIVAVPLESGGRSLGVLVAGFRNENTCANTSEHLALRASLATVVLDTRRREREAAHSSARQRALLEAGGTSILIDATGRVAGMSGGAQELLQHPSAATSSSETHGTPNAAPQFDELFRARDQKNVSAWLQRILSRPSDRDTQDDILEAELGNSVRVRVRAVVPPDGQQAVVSMQTIALLDTDVRAEPGDAQLINVIEWLEEGVVLFDADHGIRAMNTRFAQIAGIAPDEIGRITTINALISRMASQAARPESFAEKWREQARGGDAGLREEIQLLRPVPRVLERAARPITDSAGRRLGRVEIYRDLTAQRVFQSKLLQTEKLAALGQMVTGVAHELSNPLTSILGYAQRLLLDSDSANPGAAQQIFQEAERASTIVRQLLITARDSRPERRRVALNQVIARALDLLRFSLAAERVRIEQDLDADLPPILGDAGQLQQVLMNLIGNSRQAIEQGGKGGTVKLRTRRTSENLVVLEVSDDGPGIPDAILSRIFDPFFTTKPAGIGTGLGLAIVLGIVREHGGQVHVASPPGAGAKFVLEFPIAKTSDLHTPALPATGPGANIAGREVARIRKAPSALARESAPLRAWAGSRVLVVEDEPTVARLIADVLEDEGLRVDVLLDGREALRRAARENYDLVICDMKMPGIDGQHFYRGLASSGNPLRKKFLFVTGDVIASHTQEFLERHDLPHVAKPFRVEELSDKVRRVLAESSPPEFLPSLAEKTNVARK
jgi:signal transduction histidine kinase